VRVDTARVSWLVRVLGVGVEGWFAVLLVVRMLRLLEMVGLLVCQLVYAGVGGYTRCLDVYNK
jgi:hypothetical protein